MASNDVIEMQNLVIAFEKGREAKDKEWRSRIQKRIDELKVKAEKIKWNSPKIYRHYWVQIKAMEGLLKE